jgi:hypothetical protein
MKGIFTKDLSWQAKQSIPYTIVTFYGKQKKNPWPLFCKQTIPTEQPPLIGEI